MNRNVQQLVAELPEIYQTIYGHPECSQMVLRDCNSRAHVLLTIYDQLASKIGRPLRVLDLGCAQGFFCFSLAAHGAIVKGVDLQNENILLCQALASENTHLDVSFINGKIEEVIDTLEPGQYDLVIGFSVFHHIVYLYGVNKTRCWLAHLASCTELIILELALREEPLYWGPFQPADPRELLGDCAFFHEIVRCNTHLSKICRPLYVVSQHWLLLDGYCDIIEQWRDAPYTEAQGAHHGSRRYYFGKNYFCKFINFNLKNNSLLDAEKKRNQSELRRECSFLSAPPSGFVAPALLGHSINEKEGWLITERLEGELLRDILLRENRLDKARIINDLLEQLTLLEKAGLYHDDLRSWNILVNKKGEVRLIDYGSIGVEKIDCVWPYDLFQSWFIFINELFNPPTIKLDLLRPFAISPFNIPEPFRRWLLAAWNQPAKTLTFEKLKILFAQHQQLPPCTEYETGMERWIATIESGLQQLQLHVHHNLPNRNTYSFSTNLVENTIIELLRRTEALEKEILKQVKRHQDNNDQIKAILNSRSWRLMAPYRQIELQYHLLRKYGIKCRLRKFIFYIMQRTLTALSIHITQHPILKSWIINILHKIGFYSKIREFLKNFILPFYFIERGFMKEENLKTINNAKQLRFLSQLKEMDSLPKEVQTIYQQLKNKG